MSDLIVSLSNNTLRLTVRSEKGLFHTSEDISSEYVNDSSILSTDGFGRKLAETIAKYSELKLKNPQLVYLVEPSDVVLHFITVSKSETDAGEQVLGEVKKKLEGVEIDELYFGYQKIAPFVYQFVGVKKAHLEHILEAANVAKVSLAAVVPWVLLLPKYLESNDPCIFVVGDKSRHVIALAELNGIYFSQTYEDHKSAKEVQKLVQDLSVYKRTSSVSKVFTVSDDAYDFGDAFTVSPLLELADDFKDSKGYELHLLSEEVLAGNKDYLVTQVNLLTLLPVPAVVKKNTSLVYVGVFAGALLLMLGGFGIFSQLNKDSQGSEGDLAADTEVTLPPAVLSESESEESTASEEPAEVEKEKLVIRIENGAGVPGIAGEAQTFMEEKGYVIDSIGNAENSDFEVTVIRLKKSASAYQDMLLEDLSTDYKAEVQLDLEDSSDYDALIIIGQE